jgi:hypothetical protein
MLVETSSADPPFDPMDVTLMVLEAFNFAAGIR